MRPETIASFPVQVLRFTGEHQWQHGAEAASRPQEQSNEHQPPFGHQGLGSTPSEPVVASEKESVIFVSEPNGEQKVPTSEANVSGIAAGLIALVACAAVVAVVVVMVRRRKQLALHYGMLDSSSDRTAVNPVGPMAV